MSCYCRLFGSVVLIGALLTQPALASAPDIFGFGPRSLGMAGAVTASTRGAAAVYANPGGLVYETRLGVQVGFQSAHFDLSIDGAAADLPDAPALTIGLAIPIPLGGILKDRIALGFGLHLPQNSVLTARLFRPGTPHFPVMGYRAQTVTLTGALSVRITDWLGVGGGFIALAGLFGGIDVAPNETGRIGSVVFDEVTAHFTPLVGVQLHPLDVLSLGVTYRGESRADFSFPVRADLGGQVPIPIPELDIQGTAQFDPQQVAMGIALRPSDAFQFNIDLTWKQWSAYPTPLVYTVAIEGTPPQPTPNFHDILEVAAGVEGHFAPEVGGHPFTIEPRFGVRLAPTPIPAQTGLNSMLDDDRFVMATGLRLAWRWFSLEIAGQLHLMGTRTHLKDTAIALEQGAKFEDGATVSGGGLVGVWGVNLGVTL